PSPPLVSCRPPAARPAPHPFPTRRSSDLAVPIQSCQASSLESLIPIILCSGESTKNKPPNDHQACPPRFCSPSCSSKSTLFPFPATSVAVTNPERPAPTTITSNVFILFRLLILSI